MNRKLGFEIGRTSRLIKRVMDNSGAKEYIDKVTGTHGWALGYFHRNLGRDIFQKDFEKEFDIRRSTASSILSLMERNGLIERKSVPDDGRLKKIVLTEKALELHQRVDDAFCKMEEDISQGITAEETDILFKIIDKINNNIERMTDKDDKNPQ